MPNLYRSGPVCRCKLGAIAGVVPQADPRLERNRTISRACCPPDAPDLEGQPMRKVMSPIFPSPTAPAASRAGAHLRYLEYFRAVLVAKLDGLPDAELRSSRLPSGWTLELLKHVAHVEARWLEWASRTATVALHVSGNIVPLKLVTNRLPAFRLRRTSR